MNSLAFQERQFSGLREALLAQAPNEAAAILYCTSHSQRGGRRFLVREILHVPADAYTVQAPSQLELMPIFLAAAIKRARLEKTSIFLTHTHPFGGPVCFSRADDRGEQVLMPTLFQRVPEAWHGALVMGPDGFDARARRSASESVHIERLSEVGPSLHVYQRQNAQVNSVFDDVFDRSIRAFGRSGQRRLEQLTIGIVGLGGTGSLVAEQLAHLGARAITLIDPDRLDMTNLNRVVGATPSDVGRPKVEVAADHIHRVRPHVEIVPISGNVVDKSPAAALLDTDIIFCCTDTHGSRAVLNQLAYQYLIPVIDVGVRIDAHGGKATAMAGRVQMLSPGLPCLVCDEVLDPEAVRRDFLSDGQRRADPYIVGHQEPQPAIISVNGTVASLAVTMLLSAVSGLPSPPRRLIYRIAEGIVRPATAHQAEACIACSREGALARADSWAMPWRH